MGNPAARCGDTAMTCNDPADMPAGKVIAAGTVFINGMPAAKQNDTIVGVDIHIIMIPSPGGPVPTPLPHPFNGMINGSLSSSVKIMGMFAATVNSTASNTPPHIPQGGPFQKPPSNQGKIMIGSPNVMIGNGGGGGGSGGGGAEQQQEAQAEAAEAAEGHFIHARYTDRGGKPITGVDYRIRSPEGDESGGTLTGEVRREGVPEGNHEIRLRAITRAGWEKEKAESGEEVKLEIETAGFDDGTEAVIEIWMKDIGRADRKLETIEGRSVSGDSVEAEWLFDYLDEEAPAADRYSSPQFYFIVDIDGVRSRSGLLAYSDYVEIELRDKDGNPIKGERYILRFSNGEVREGKLDGRGSAREEKCPPVRHEVQFPDLPAITEVE
jgi:uncharacterized Zn-binding protein involved in type VI secretion